MKKLESVAKMRSRFREAEAIHWKERDKLLRLVQSLAADNQVLLNRKRDLLVKYYSLFDEHEELKIKIEKLEESLRQMVNQKFQNK